MFIRGEWMPYGNVSEAATKGGWDEDGVGSYMCVCFPGLYVLEGVCVSVHEKCWSKANIDFWNDEIV